MKLTTVAAWLCAAALAVIAPIAHAAWGGTSGSGQLKTEARAVSGFQAIATRGSVKLVLRQGTREGMELRADDNILPLIETRVVDRGGVPTLEIGPKDNASFSTRNPVVATIDLITLRALTSSGSSDVVCEALKAQTLKIAISGSGDVRLHQLAADELAIRISGSGNIELSGKVPTLALNIAGSGDANTRSLEADDVSVSVAGSGDVTVNARKTLNVSVAGSGSVAYVGTAAVTSSVAGSGRVRKL